MSNTEKKKDEFDLALEDMKMETEVDLDRLIEKRVKQMMVRTSLKVVLVVLLIAALIFLGLNPIMNLCYTNPIKADEAKDGYASRLFQTLSAYVETVYPQMKLCTIGEIEKKGFGKYEIPLCLGIRTQRLFVGKMNASLEMVRGELSVKSDSEGALSHKFSTTIANAADAGITNFAEYNDSELEDLAELPKSARILLQVQLHKSVKLEDVLALRQGTLKPVWAQMDTKSEGFMGGISLEGPLVLYEGDEERTNMSASQLREVYIKNLKTLSENYELWNGLGISWGSSWAPGEVALRHINDALADAENTETFMTKNFYLYGSRDDIMKYIEDNKEEFCSIEDVRLSELVG